MTAKQLPPGDWRIAVYGRGQISGIGRRRHPRQTEKERVITRQGYRCLYCEIPIATKVLRKGREVELRPHWDHFVPFAYSQRNPSANWVLACHVCNGIKYSRIFADVESARRVILPARLAKGYEEPDAVFHRLGLECESGAALVTVAKPSRRQLEALRHAAAGLRLADIAREMRISPATTSEFLKLAIRRVGAETCEQAIEIAVRNGFINPPPDR